MITATITQFGGPEVFTFEQAPDPTPQKNEVVIDVKTIGFGGIDAILRRGELGAQNPQPPFVPGLEVAGIVESVGANVTNLSVGQRAVGIMPKNGGYATKAVVLDALAVPLPDNLPFETAALVVNYTTAVAALAQLGPLPPKTTVLVNGAGGGLGQAFGRVIKTLYPAMTIIGTSRSPLKNDIFDQIVTDLTKSQHEFTYIFDPVGGTLRQISLEKLAPFGTLVALGSASNDPQSKITSQTLWLGGRTITGFNLGLLSHTHPQKVRVALKKVIALLATSKITPPTPQIFSFNNIAKAHTFYETGKGNTIVMITN